MAASTADNLGCGESPAEPAITVTRAGVVIGTEFLPDHDVTVSISRPGEDIADYLNYTTDRDGRLYADLPATALTGTLYVAATDHRPDPDGACGLLWSNTYILNAGGA
jgi:hypothetical protein